MTAWQLAAERGNWQSIEKMWEWAKAELSTDDLNNQLLLATDDREQTVLHYATLCDKQLLIGRMRKWVKEL
jgi:hypothetical protein